MVAESRQNLMNWVMCLLLLLAFPPAFVRVQQRLFSGRCVLEGKGAEIVDNPETDLLAVRMAGPSFSDHDVARLRGLRVDRLILRETGISDRAIRELANHPELVSLDLSGTNVSAAGVAMLARFPNLMQLRLEDCRRLSLDDLRPLAQSSSLRILLLGVVSYSPDDLKRLDTLFRIPVSVDPASYLGTPTWLRPVWLNGKHAAVKVNFFASVERPHQVDMLAIQLASIRHPEIVEQLHLYFMDPPDANAPSRIEGIENCFPNLTTIWMAGAADAELSTIGKCTTVSELNLIDGWFTDEGVARLTHLPRLRRLRLQSQEVDGRGLGCLGALASLEYLDVSCPAAVARDLERWRSFGQLRTLVLDVSSAPGQELAELAAITSLETLKFGRTDLSQANLDWVARLENLRNDPRKLVMRGSAPVGLD